MTSTLKKNKRPLNDKEVKALKKIRSTANSDLKRGHRFHYLLMAAALGATCVFLARETNDDFLIFVFGTIAVLSFSVLIFLPYEKNKMTKAAKRKIRDIETILVQGSIETSVVKAVRIAVAEEFEDEGDLYIIETTDKSILYMWDSDYTLKKSLPCLEFEIYNNELQKLLNRQVNAISEKITPVLIDSKAKSAYLKKVGTPEHLAIEKKKFEKIVDQMKNAG